MVLRFRYSLFLAAVSPLTWAALLWSAPAGAQADVEKPLPNVMLLIDSSGSMEFKAEANGEELPVCNPGEPLDTNEKSRWIDLLEVMTGSFEGYSCFAQSRDSSAFRSEFMLGTDNVPYDYGYNKPYHRAISNGCVVGPGVAPDSNAPYDFPTRAINTFEFTAPSTVTRPADLESHTGCADFSQKTNGVLDIYNGRLRFGLMTFDSHPDPGTGISGLDTVDHESGISGTWSYFLNGSYRTGRPPLCDSDLPQEVGARNAAAPPWEGRMVAFGAANAAVTDTQQRDEWIQQVLLATRPYGATPIAGLMHDARDFLWNDDSSDPLDSAVDFGPRADPLWLKSDCRKTVLILMSDGEPNLDLRPFCEDSANGGICPYSTPASIAASLLSDAPTAAQEVETFVIGFALDEVQPQGVASPIGCADLTPDQCAQNPDDRGIQACCTLNEIALAGSESGERKAYFPTNTQELRSVFNEILGQLGTGTTRSAPAFGGSIGGVAGLELNASFEPIPGSLWRGRLTRTRTVCDNEGVPVEVTPLPAEGDDFAANVNSAQPADRKFYTVIAEEVDGDVPNGRSLRPKNISTTDGLTNLNTPTEINGVGGTELVTNISAAAMDVQASDCVDAGTAASCRDIILNWTVGIENAENRTRCEVPGLDCNVFGGIYHSSPKLVEAAPSAYIRSEPYRRFADEMQALARPSVLYTSTVDGFLHAFKLAPYAPDAVDQVNSLANNELWAFVPPAVLPTLKSQYPDTPAILLDGEPIIAEVVAREDSTVFETTATDAQEGAGTFRTVLISGFGEGQVNGGYFALDVTDPEAGPEFLWQLTRNDANQPLFGNGGTPLITTVGVTPDSGVATNIPVAVLPGGDSGTVSTTPLTVSAGSALDVTFTGRTESPTYVGGEASHSLTIVRLDTGEILRTFRAADSATALGISAGVVIDTAIPSPIVGQPVAYPAEIGAVADRIFVGDRDGRLWRINVASPNPDEWEMSIFFDAFYDQEFDEGQPIETQPVLSLNSDGNITIAFSTGSQDVQPAPTGTLNRIVSLTETLSGSNDFVASVNWVKTLGCDGSCPADSYEGERVTGPMTLFSSSLYFSTGIPETDASEVCAQQRYRLWGMDYVVPKDDQFDGGAARITESDAAPDTLVQARAPEQGVVFGASLQRTPTCYTEEVSTDDPYFGTQTHTTSSQTTPSSYQLTFQVGGVTGNAAAGVATQSVVLAPPPKTVRIDGWAYIFE